MTLEQTLTDVALEAAKHADSANKLIDNVKDSIEAIKVVSDNHQVMDDWRTKTGKVAFKDLAGHTHQVDTLATIIADAEKINPNPHVMSKAQFDALREIRKKQYAGSGFVEWGKNHTSTSMVINEGMGAFGQTRLLLGPATTKPVGRSRTLTPECLIDGVKHKLSYIKTSTSIDNDIKFPPAPDGTKTYDSATGVVTEHASAAEAFNERKYTTPIIEPSFVSWDAATNTATFSATSPNGPNFSTGKSTGAIKLIAVVESSENSIIELRDVTSPNGSAPLITSKTLSAGEATSIEAEYTATTTGVYFRVPTPQVGQTLKIHSFQVLTSTESVITSRKDLVFLETWYEAIADKDQVYPLGNVQYGATTYEGMTLATRNDGYTRFGEWDTTTTGKYSTWSTLTETEKRAYINDPDNNIYYDSDADKLIQVRYRVRVVEGLGDDWDGYRAADNASTMRYSTNRYIKPWGFNADGDTRGDYVFGNYFFFVSKGHGESLDGLQSGSFGVRQSEAPYYSERGCNAVPIALVQRMNQGAYHPTYNPMGTSYIWNGSTTVTWYNQFYRIDSKSRAFTDVPPTAAGDGSIAGGSGGRSDQYKFYDAIYAGQVEDLRLNANKLDVNQLREESMRKAVAGEMRGKRKVPFTNKPQEITTGSTGYQVSYLNTVGKYHSGWGEYNISSNLECHGYILLSSGRLVKGIFGSSPQDTNTLRVYWNNLPSHGVDYSWLRGQGEDAIVQEDLNAGNFWLIGWNFFKQSSEFDSLPWVDIIGHPERIAATFPDGVVGQWVPQVPVNVVQTYYLNHKSVGAAGNTGFTTHNTVNDGLSWASSHGGNWGFSATTNSFRVTLSTTFVGILIYESPSNFTEPSNNSVVIGDVGDVYVSQAHQVDYGNRLQPSLTGKIGKRSGGAFTQESLSVTKSTKYAPTGTLGWTGAIGDEPEHASLNLDTPDNNSPAVKALSTITEKDGLLYLQLHGTELNYDKKTPISISGGSTEAKSNFHVYKVTSGQFQGRLFKRANSSASSEPFDSAEWVMDSVGLKFRNNTAYSYFLYDTHLDWGDDQVIPIVHRENVKTDLNGNMVKVFCHHTQIPLGIAAV